MGHVRQHHSLHLVTDLTHKKGSLFTPVVFSLLLGVGPRHISDTRFKLVYKCLLVAALTIIIIIIIIIIIDRFYIALFSALEQTHCARM